MYKVKNNSKTRQRIVYAKNGRQVAINPGATVEVDIPEAQAMRMENVDGELQVMGGSDGGDKPSKRSAGKVEEASVDNTKPVQRKKGDMPKDAPSLLEAHENNEISYPDFVAQSRALLGDDFPKGRGTPKKEKIAAALRKAK